MGTEKFCLRWNDFESNISVAFRELREEKDFFDVTLACDDSQVQAHKVILSACSPFFRSVLRRNPHQHPLLYLKGVKYKELLSVLNFMYMGEVNVAQEELNSFLSVAEDLRVKGLTQNNSSPAQESSPKTSSKPDNQKQSVRPRDPIDRDTIAPPPKRSRPVVPVQQLSTSSFQAEDDDVQEVVPVKTEPRDPSPHVPPQESPAIVQPTPMYHSQQQPHQLQQEQDQGTVALEDTYDESYDYSYEGYDDGSGMVDPNTGMPYVDSGADKVLQDYVKSKAVPAKGLDGSKIWKCPDCEYKHKKNSNMFRHIQKIHTFFCYYCIEFYHTAQELSQHRNSVHVVL